MRAVAHSEPLVLGEGCAVNLSCPYTYLSMPGTEALAEPYRALSVDRIYHM